MFEYYRGIVGDRWIYTVGLRSEMMSEFAAI